MRVLFLVLLCLVGTALFGLGRLVEPDGSSRPLGENPAPDGLTLTFSPRSIPLTSWLVLPPGTQLLEAVLASSGARRTLSVPTVRAPGVRYALEVPPHLLSLTLRGRIPTSPTLLRTLVRPESATQTWVAVAPGSLTVSLPSWKVPSGFVGALELSRTTEGPWNVTLSGNGSSRTFELGKTQRTWLFHPAAWGFAPTRLQATGKDSRLSEVRVRAFRPEESLLADPESLLAWPAEAWRDSRREWFSWSGTSVLVLLCRDYRVQDLYLRRLAFYVEKTGYRGRLVPDEEIAPLHGWNAHDYAAKDLARFFSQAVRESFPLNPSELELRDRLVAVGILVPNGSEGWEAGTGALIGVSAESPPALRSVLFVHEAYHGLYFTGPEFRSGVEAAWRSLSPEAQQAFREFLALSRYDPADEGLMINEFQSYVLQRDARDWTGFFRDKVLAKVGKRAQSISWLTEYLEAARTLDALVGHLYGLRSGSVSSFNSL